MYTVVTHTIKEEHFGHPATAEIGMAMHAGKGNTAPHGSTISSNAHPKTMTITARDPKHQGNVSVLPPTGVPVLPPKDGNVKVKLVANVKVKREGNIKAGVKSKQEYSEYSDWDWGSYDAWGDLTVHGDTCVAGDLEVYGLINGTTTSVHITMLETDPTSKTWTGNIGELSASPRYMYACVETDTWVRWPIQANW